MTPAELARLFDQPAEAGARAQAARASHFGRRVQVRGTPPHPPPTVAALLRGAGPVVVDLPGWSQEHVARAMADATGRSGHAESDMSSGTCASAAPGWPEPAALRAGDRVVLQVDRARLGDYFEYLVRLAAAAPEGLSVAPYCALAGGLMRLHLIAAARVALPGRVRVEARHDLLGIRLAQVALGFGADTLAGPLAQTRKLPLAGVPRPDEATPAGLAALIERAGLEPVLDDMTSETLP
ncbi:hypothetical protein [Nannocystis bainbridge]|uniref:Uncharacterized protein n=1 Tax=Nannocystis bainbridge TaxID=2995303 RepID=A0ABT5E1J1_9BACT|nr:hypothetical protein [Nannocystis bainbridge]MDC0719740.1 hypothetical protein [Nannocystis bainbridge]